MQVIVCHTFCSRIGDSSDWVVAGLGKAMRRRGHDLEDVMLPFDPCSPPLEQVLAFRLFTPAQFGDVLVALHPPCHVTCHPRKVIWAVDSVFHNEDLLPPVSFAANAASGTVLESLRASDKLGLGEARRVCLRSQASCEKHLHETGTSGVFLPLPPKRLERSVDFEPVLAARTQGAKPALMITALEALACSPADLRLALFGPCPFSPQQWGDLLSRYGVESRVDLSEESGWPGILPSILAVLDLTVDPDLLGENAIDAHGCGKPIIGFDSLAAREWIQPETNGLTAPLDAAALSSVLVTLNAHRDRADALGLAGRARLDSWGANWDRTVETLTEQ